MKSSRTILQSLCILYCLGISASKLSGLKQHARLEGTRGPCPAALFQGPLHVQRPGLAALMNSCGFHEELPQQQVRRKSLLVLYSPLAHSSHMTTPSVHVGGGATARAREPGGYFPWGRRSSGSPHFPLLGRRSNTSWHRTAAPPARVLLALHPPASAPPARRRRGGPAGEHVLCSCPSAAARLRTARPSRSAGGLWRGSGPCTWLPGSVKVEPPSPSPSTSAWLASWSRRQVYQVRAFVRLCFFLPFPGVLGAWAQVLLASESPPPQTLWWRGVARSALWAWPPQACARVGRPHVGPEGSGTSVPLSETARSVFQKRPLMSHLRMHLSRRV